MIKFGSLAIAFALSALSAYATVTVTPWTATETSLFSPIPDANFRTDAAVWTANTLQLSYDNRIINHTLYPSAQSTATSQVVPSLLSAVTPLNLTGISFDFSQTGYFTQASFDFLYFIPVHPNAVITPGMVGSNNIFGATINSATLAPAAWMATASGDATVGGGTTPNLTQNPIGGSTHVNLYFSPTMLEYLDGLIAIDFISIGADYDPSHVQDFAGTAKFANVSWLTDDATSPAVPRWHSTADKGSGSSVSEPSSLALFLIGFAGLFSARRWR